jgi:dihydroxy-acid dehydratase
LAIVKDGDPITIDAVERTVNLDLPAQVIQSRLARWRKPKPRYRRGVLAKYAAHVTTASMGAVTDSGF